MDSQSQMNSIAQVELHYRHNLLPTDMPQIRTPVDAFQLLLQEWDKNAIDYTEHAKLMLLSRSNRVLGVSELSRGGTSGTVVDTKVVLTTALLANAQGIILAHNHPSGNVMPSQYDRNVTAQLNLAATYMGIWFADHLIICRDEFYSFSQETDELIVRAEQYAMH